MNEFEQSNLGKVTKLSIKMCFIIRKIKMFSLKNEVYFSPMAEIFSVKLLKAKLNLKSA